MLYPGGSLRVPMSREEYDALGEAKRHEWYDGLCVVNPPMRQHVVLSKRLERLLDDVCPPGYLVYQEWGWATEGGGFIPDLMIAPADGPNEPWLRQPPLLAVEILSASTRDVDFGRKRELYAAGGLESYWVVDPMDRSVTVFRTEHDELRVAQVIQGSPAVTAGVIAARIDPEQLFAT